MQTIGSTVKSPTNTRFFLAFQSARDVIPAPVLPDPAVYFEMDGTAADVGRNVELERTRTMRSGREEGKPLRGAINAPQSLTDLVDKRFIGVHLGALLGSPVSTDANATGFLMFERQPAAGETIVINDVVWTFVDVAQVAYESAIGETLGATVIALAAALNASADADIAEATYLASGHRLIVTADASGAAGNDITLGAGTAGGYASGATLAGGGLRKHVFRSGAAALPMLSLVTDQTDMTDGPRFKAVKNLRYGGMQMDLRDSGAASITFTAIGTDEVTLDADPVADHTVPLKIERYSHIQGGILVDDGCVKGVIEGGGISYSNGLATDRTLGCPGSPSAGTIHDALPGDVECSVNVNARYYAAGVTGKAEAGETVKIVYQFVDPADGSTLTFTFAQVTLPETTRGYNLGSAGITQNFNGVCSKPPGGWAMVVELVNDRQDY